MAIRFRSRGSYTLDSSIIVYFFPYFHFLNQVIIFLPSLIARWARVGNVTTATWPDTEIK